jgi:hypothetical protein
MPLRSAYLFRPVYVLLFVMFFAALESCSAVKQDPQRSEQRIALTEHEASNSWNLISNNSEIRNFLDQLDEKSRNSIRFTAGRVALHPRHGSQLFVRLVSREICDGNLCPVFLVGGSSERFVTMLEHQASRITLPTPATAKGYRPFRLYFENSAHADFYCTPQACSTPS